MSFGLPMYSSDSVSTKEWLLVDLLQHKPEQRRLDAETIASLNSGYYWLLRHVQGPAIRNCLFQSTENVLLGGCSCRGDLTLVLLAQGRGTWP